MQSMPDTEMWRKAFSAISLLEDMVSSLLGNGASAPQSSSKGMPDLNVPPGVDPMSAYGPE